MIHVLTGGVTISKLQGTHIFFVVVAQGEFSLRQHELSLQKLCVVFAFLQQYSFIEP